MLSFPSTPRQDSNQKLIAIPTLNTEKMKHRQKGIVLFLPQRHDKLGPYKKELKLITWFLSQTLYYLHIMNLLPSGEANVLWIKQPRWNYQYIHRTPGKSDFIIEPDWHSGYIK